MFRILLVDDEANIVDALYDYLETKCPDQFDLLKAYSGEDALGFMERMRIDIVITDIMMPAVDGVDLLKQITARWPRCKVIFFTCHDDFDYAYQATNYKCFKYLLKYDGYDRVLETIQEAVAVLKSELFGILPASGQENGMGAGGQTPKALLERLVHGETYSKEALAARFRDLNLHLDAGKPVYHFCMKISAPTGKYDRNISFLNGLAEKVDEELSRSLVSVPYFEDGSVFWFVQQTDEADENAESVTVKGVLELMLENAEPPENVRLWVAVCRSPSPWDAVAQNYFALKSLIAQRHGGGETVLSCNNEDILGITVRQALAEGFAMGKAGGAHIRSACYEKLRVCLENEPERFREICSYFNKYLKCLMILENLDGAERLDTEPWLNPDSSDFDRLSEGVEKVIGSVESQQEKESVLETQKFLQQAKDYIAENYSRNISLTDIAEHVFLNASYFSRIFKQHCGVNVIDYLNQVRIQAAKDLLVQTNRKIVDIAEQVGFNSPGYFANVFRKYTGTNPKEYRV